MSGTYPAEKLFLAIGGVPEELVNEAAEPAAPREKRPVRRWMALAAAFVLTAGVGLYTLLPRMGGGTGGMGISRNDADPGSVAFMSYGGPVLPLTVVDGPEGLPATREVTWGFLSTVDSEKYTLCRAEVTDTTVITNNRGQDLTITIGYPVTSTLREKDLLPTLTVDGEIVATSLLWGSVKDAAGDESRWSPRLESWEDCTALLEDDSYLRASREDPPALEQTVTVWELTDSAAPDTDKGAPTLAVSFRIDEERTRVYTWGFNGAEFSEDGTRRYSYFVPREHERDSRRLLIFLGEVPKEYTMAGYRDGGCDKPLEGVSAGMTAFSSTLGEMVDQLVVDRYWDLTETVDARLKEVQDAARRMMARFLPEKRRYDYFMMEDLVSYTLTTTRVVWTTAEVRIPAGEEITVTACFRKDPSFDYACTNTKRQGLYGFDLGARLGSSLDFQRLTARLEYAGQLVIEGQNFGFDLTGGVTEVGLDPEKEYYYMEIRRKE